MTIWSLLGFLELRLLLLGLCVRHVVGLRFCLGKLLLVCCGRSRKVPPVAFDAVTGSLLARHVDAVGVAGPTWLGLLLWLRLLL